MIELFSTRPDLADASHRLSEIASASAELSGEAFLAAVEQVYDEFRLSEPQAYELAKIATSRRDFHGACAAAIYLEAFETAGRRFKRVQENVRQIADPELVIEYLTSRPSGIVNFPLLNRLKSIWFGQQRNLSDECDAASMHEIDLLIVGEGAETVEDLRCVLRASGVSKIDVLTIDQRKFERLVEDLSSDELDRLRISHVAKIDQEADAEIFASADLMAASFATQMAEAFESEVGARLDGSVYDALLVLLRDAFAPCIRIRRAVARATELGRNAGILVFSRFEVAFAIAQFSRVDAFGVELAEGRTKFVKFQRLAPDELIAHTLAIKDKLDQRRLAAPPPKSQQRPIVVCAKAADRQSMGNLGALVQELCDVAPLYLEPGGLTHEGAYSKTPQLLSGALTTLIEQRRVEMVWTEKCSVFSHWHAFALKSSMDAAFKTLSRAEDSDAIVLAMAYATIRRALKEFEARAADWLKIVQRSRAVLVFPGRHVSNLAAVSAARKCATPSYELQNGTVSASGRFVQSIADILFVNDEFSKQVFEESIGTREGQLSLVGSPRIDEDVRYARAHTPSEARRASHGFGLSREDKLVVFATQPIEIVQSEQLMRLVIGACELLPENWKLTIRLHPTETDRWTDIYEKIIQQSSLSAARFLPSARDGLELRGADAVLTYYSTVGLEALALDKRVICVAPRNDIQPPFDLCTLGAEGPYSESGEVAAALASPISPNKQPATIVTKGNAAKNIRQVIEQRVN